MLKRTRPPAQRERTRPESLWESVPQTGGRGRGGYVSKAPL